MLTILCLVLGGYCLGMGVERAWLPGQGLNPAYHLVMGPVTIVVGVIGYFLQI